MRGVVYTNVKTNEGETRTARWRNGKVALPILSTHEPARDGSTLEYDERGGVIRDKGARETTTFILTNCVYFVRLRVPEHAAAKPFQPSVRQR